ncbi:MAG TPA: hypothetical protein VH877_05165 [Polyangia bacterium]|jgi:hypothetical protein|nr:hypothetical protein [Polyangia bacterium]
MGHAVLDAAKTIDTRAVKARLTTFARVHREYLAVEAKVGKAEEAMRAQQAKLGEADARQDEATEALAEVLIKEGLPRTNPFKPLGFPPPALIVKLDGVDEAQMLLKLAKRVAASRETPRVVVSAARAAARAAQSVLKAVGPLTRLMEAHRAALGHRDALAQKWEKTFAALKQEARAAADAGAVEIYDALFGALSPRRASTRTRTRRATQRLAAQRIVIPAVNRDPAPPASDAEG